MSKIKQIVQSRINELAILELDEEENHNRNSEMTAMSLRIPKDSVRSLDLVAEKLQLSRSDVARAFIQAATTEALQELNLSPSEVIDFIERQDEIELEGKLNE